MRGKSRMIGSPAAYGETFWRAIYVRLATGQ
jgi:hypothetical protein